MTVSPAIADNPEHTYSGQQVTRPIPFFPGGETCDGFVPLITFTSEYNIINSYDDAGRLVKQIRHVTFTGTLYNSTDLSKSIPYEGDFTRTFYPSRTPRPSPACTSWCTSRARACWRSRSAGRSSTL